MIFFSKKKKANNLSITREAHCIKLIIFTSLPNVTIYVGLILSCPISSSFFKIGWNLRSIDSSLTVLLSYLTFLIDWNGHLLAPTIKRLSIINSCLP